MIDLQSHMSGLNVSVYDRNDGVMGLGRKRYTELKDRLFWKTNQLDLELCRLYREWKDRQRCTG